MISKFPQKEDPRKDDPNYCLGCLVPLSEDRMGNSNYCCDGCYVNRPCTECGPMSERIDEVVKFLDSQTDCCNSPEEEIKFAEELIKILNERISGLKRSIA